MNSDATDPLVRSPLGIRRLLFRPGDVKVPYRSLPGFEAGLSHWNIPDDEELWGWGYVRRCSLDFGAAVEDCFESLVQSLASAEQIGALIACIPCHNSGEDFRAVVTERLLPRLGLSLADVQFVQDHDCVNVLRALELARERCVAGPDDVLVLAAEKVENDDARLRKYSLFSDFSLALVVSRRLDDCRYEMVDVRVESDPTPRSDTGGILVRTLEQELTSRVLHDCALTTGAIGKFLYVNLFPPMVEMKAKTLGFRGPQIFTGLSHDIAHCYGADPFANLQACEAAATPATSYLLCASGRAHAGVCVLTRREAEPC